MRSRLSKHLVLAGAVAGMAILPACSSGSDGAPASDGSTREDTTRTMIASLGDLEDLSTLNTAIGEAELTSIFDGPSAYTLLAPTNDAFNSLGESVQDLMSREQRPLLVGLLREHLLPGALTPEDISAAIEAQNSDVTMRTLGGGTVTFSQAGDALMVSNELGSSAQVVSSATAATNGVIIPLDTVLVPEDAPGG